MHPNPRPARRRKGDAAASRGLGRESQRESRGQNPLPLSAQDAAPARGARRIGAGAGQSPAAVRVGRLSGEG